ncbi:PTS glucose transporter subunit IIA [Orbaceae bacterium ac157xtp]
MFGLFKKKVKTEKLYSVCNGKLKSIDKVNDVVFSDKLMGDGFAVTPVKGTIQVYSPIKGKVLSVFPTKHAITFVTDEGIEGLIHMGIDTVALGGNGFTIHVQENQKVDQNTLFATMDVDFITEQGKDTNIIVVFTNLSENQTLTLENLNKVEKNQLVGNISL